MPGFHFPGYQTFHVLTLIFTRNDRFDRRAARRQLVDHRNVEITVDRHRERAWNRRRGHDEHVRIEAARAQFGALHDAETMLFVDDYETEVCKRDAFLHERVRADARVDLTRSERRAELFLFRGAKRSGQ